MRSIVTSGGLLDISTQTEVFLVELTGKATVEEAAEAFASACRACYMLPGEVLGKIYEQYPTLEEDAWGEW